MFDALRPPADLASARARLRRAAELEADADRPGSDGTGDGTGAGVIVDLMAADLDRPGAGIGDEARLVVADSILWRAGEAELARLADGLGDRPVLFLEPIADAGWRGLVHRLGRPLWLRSTGHDHRSDVPAALRRAGLVVTDLSRFGLGRFGLRSYGLGRAQRIR